MISGGQNVDIMLVLIGFTEMCVFSQVSFFNDLFEKSKGKKPTWANPMCSKQWKSLCEIDIFHFLVCISGRNLLKNIKNYDFRGPFGSAPVGF